MCRPSRLLCPFISYARVDNGTRVRGCENGLVNSGKKMREELLGFDMRLCPEDYVKTWWHERRRLWHLINPKIDWPLSVDVMVWPSVFHYIGGDSVGERSPYYFYSNGTLEVSPSDYRHRVIRLWPNLDDMTSYFLSYEERFMKKAIPVAIVAHSEEPLENYDEPSAWLGALSPRLLLDTIPRNWLFLGYDVADTGLISGLSNCGYAEKEREHLGKVWCSRLNEYGLIKTLHEALVFRDLTNTREPEHAPFFVFSLYRAPEALGKRG